MNHVCTLKGFKALRKVFTSIHGESEKLHSYFFQQLYLLISKNTFDLLPTGELYKYMHFTFTSEYTQERKRKDNQLSEK